MAAAVHAKASPSSARLAYSTLCSSNAMQRRWPHLTALCSSNAMQRRQPHLTLICPHVRWSGSTWCDRAHAQRRVPLFNTKKYYNSRTKKIKLNSDCTIKFVSINPSNLDLIWIYLDKVTSGSHSG
jgi:hypothetical protein